LRVSVLVLNGKGGTSLMKAEGCTEWTSPWTRRSPELGCGMKQARELRGGSRRTVESTGVGAGEAVERFTERERRSDVEKRAETQVGSVSRESAAR
jgi:hypothetical protein